MAEAEEQGMLLPLPCDSHWHPIANLTLRQSCHRGHTIAHDSRDRGQPVPVPSGSRFWWSFLAPQRVWLRTSRAFPAQLLTDGVSSDVSFFSGSECNNSLAFSPQWCSMASNHAKLSPPTRWAALTSPRSAAT